MKGTSRSTLVFFVFLAAAGLMLLNAMHQLSALDAGVAGFETSLRSGEADRSRPGSNDDGGFSEPVSFSDELSDGAKLIGPLCRPRGAVGSVPTKACREVTNDVAKIAGAEGDLVGAVLPVVATQLSFVALAAAAVAFSLMLTIGLAVLIDHLAESMGLRFLSVLVNRVIDTIPYTIWLVLMAAAFGAIIAVLGAQDRAGMSLQTQLAILVGQAAVYVGVSLLLMPLFLNFLLETLRAARRDGVFDMVAMDGLTSRRAYRRVILVESREILLKAMLFGTLFVLLFDPVFERLSRSRAYDYAGQLEGVLPQQAFQSTFYQWALIRFDDPGHPLFEKPETKIIERDIEQLTASTNGLRARRLATRLKGPAPGEAPISDAPRVVSEFAAYPGLLLDAARWRILIADDTLCSRSRTCLAVKQGGGIGDHLARMAIRGGFATAYYYINMSLLLLMIGGLATWEFSKSYKRRMEQV